ncbi:hypothetical protein KI387_034082, partial [Taxus chinensis]
VKNPCGFSDCDHAALARAAVTRPPPCSGRRLRRPPPSRRRLQNRLPAQGG